MKALVLCGGMPQLSLLRELRSRGIASVLADANEHAPAVKYADIFYPVSTLDEDAIRRIAQEEKVDFIISVCADQMLLVAAKLSEEFGLPCYISYETAKNVSNKEYMKRIFEENNIPTAKYIVRSKLSPEDIGGIGWPAIVKPVDCYSSKGVRKVQNENELREAFERAAEMSRTKRVVIEEFVDGDELSVDIYVERGAVKILCIRLLDKIPNMDGFIICRGRYPAFVSDDILAQIQKIGQDLALAFNLHDTPMLIQMKIDGGIIKVIEFCARTGGGIKYRLLPRVSGFNVVNAVLDLTLGERPHCQLFHLDKYIIDEFIYCKPGVFDHLEGFDELMADGIITHYSQFKARGHEFKTIASSSDRVAYFNVEADSLPELELKHIIAGERVKALSTAQEDLIRHDIVRSFCAQY